MAASESEESQPQQEEESSPERGRGARIAGTAIVAVGVVVLIFAASVAAFYLLAGLLQGNWLMGVVSLVILAALLWLMSRLMRVAANQNKKPLG